jgi:hypothetical protein
MLRLATMFVALAIISASALASNALAVAPSRIAGEASISRYVSMPGDQVVTVPDGTYTGGTVSAPHPATHGKNRGWLVLRARTKDGVVVDLAGNQLTLDAQTSRVLFVGFRFVNGSIRVYGHDIAFWYTDHTFSAQVWARQAADPSHPERGYYRAPRTIYVDQSSSVRDSFYGTDAHDTGTAFLISRSSQLSLTGVHTWNLTDAGLDPNDVVHSDAIGDATGTTHHFSIRSSWIEGRILVEDSAGQGGSKGGPNRDMLFEDLWSSGSPSVGFIFTSGKATEPRGIFGRRVRVRSWGHHAQQDRIDTIDGVRVDPNADPRRIDIVDEQVVTTPPPPNAKSPAATWRADHPYESWPSYFGFASSSQGTGALGIALLAAGVVALLATSFFTVFHRRRRVRRGARKTTDQAGTA